MLNDIQLDYLIKIVQNTIISNSEHLLKGKYKHSAIKKSLLDGHCYVGTEVIYHLYGKFNGYTPKVVNNKHIENDISKQWTHWFLQNKTTGHIIDVTSEQFDDEELLFCYKNGIFKGFLTGNTPSKRSKYVLDLISL